MDGAALEIHALGELELRRHGKLVALPPSKKTRALLAYLVLTGRPHRREALCGLFWDVTDDPRGALRWSLSRLRKQVDDEGVQRLRADRERVGFELHGAAVDVLSLREDLGGGRHERAETALLERWCERCAGEMLAGLDLPDFDAYQAWLVAEREATRRLRAAILRELTRRHEATPELALRHAHGWVQVDPMSAEARLSAMRLALATGQVEEARRQYQSARRLFSELDPAKERALTADWHALRGRAPGASDPAPQSEPSEIHTGRASSPSLAGAPPLVGRGAELETLRAAVSEVTRTRRSQLWLLTGEPGIGKSRLLGELRREQRARGSAVLHGAAFEGETGRPYGPWIDALRKARRANLREDLRKRLSPLLEGGVEAHTHSREALFSGVVELLTELTATRAPVLLVLDDAHWLDQGSAELLHYIARMQRDQPMLFVLSARPAELQDQQWVLRVLRSLRRDLQLRELALPPLTEEATRTLVREVDAGVDAEQLFAHSGGNPLFALELARAGGVPERALTVADAVRDRVARLPAEAGDVLRWGAVLGTAFDARQIAALSSLTAEQQLGALEELERHALLRLEPPQGYAFAHEIVRRVVYGDLSQPRRLLMHRRAAEALRALYAERSGSVDEDLISDIARHAALAEDHALAASAYVAAGQRCLKLFANENAAALARKGMRHARELFEPERSCKMLELTDVQLWAQRPADEDAFVHEVHELAETALRHGAVDHARLGFKMLSYVRWESGRWDDARAQVLKAEQAVRAGEGIPHIEALAEAACCLARLERDMAQAEAMLAEARARAQQLGYQSRTLANAGALLMMHMGEFETATRLFEQARALARAEGSSYAEIQALVSQFELHFDWGRFDRALALAEETCGLADRTRDGSEGPYARVMLALVQLALGDATAEGRLDAALSDLRAADAKHRLAYALNRAASLLLERGRCDGALNLSEEALDTARFLERPSDIVLALVTMIRAHRKRGDLDACERSLRQLDRGAWGRLSAHAARARAALLQEER